MPLRDVVRRRAPVLGRLTGDGGEVVAFEANPETAATLACAMRRRGNVTVERRAVADAAGARELRAGFGRHSATWTLEGGDGPAVSVEATTLDDYFADRPLGLAKIDVEGAEVAVLRGARRVLEREHPTLVIELHGEERRVACDALLRQLGYRIEAIGDQHVLAV